MSKEELFDQGWDLVYSGPTEVKAWGVYMVHLHHGLGSRVSGYGSDEQAALNDAAETIKKHLEVPKNEVHH
jgi:hypothetical protein